MKTVWSEKIDNILKEGCSLNKIGVNNWALNKNQALKALTKLEELQVSILGGDVCELIDGVLQYNYDSWHCDQMKKETKGEFLLRSIAETKQYINNYQSNDIDKIFFAFVPEV